MGNGQWDSAINNGVWDGNRDYITVFLDGSQSSDPEYGSGENALDFVWQQVSGPNVFLNTLVDPEDWLDCNDQQTLCDGDIGWNPSMGNGQWDEGEVIIENVDGLEGDYYYGGKVEPIFNAVVPYGTNPEVYEFTLIAEDTYFKGWPPEPYSHQFPENVAITVFPERNEAPTAIIEAFIPDCDDDDILDPIYQDICWVLCTDNWECDYSVYEYEEDLEVFFDHRDEENILGPTWRIPHDGNPYTNLAFKTHNLYNIYFALIYTSYSIPPILTELFQMEFNYF